MRRTITTEFGDQNCTTIRRMRAEDDTLYETMLKVENKDIFIDLKRNKSGVYLKISERNGSSRNTVLIPISGITRLKKVLDDVSAASETIKVVRSVSNPIIG